MIENPLFKSEIGSHYKYRWIPFFIGGFIFLPGFIYFIYLRLTLPIWDNYYIMAPTAAVTFLIPSIILFWFGLQFIGSYLIIYPAGIQVRRPYRFFLHKPILWSSIREVRFFDRGVLISEYSTHPYDTIEIYFREGNVDKTIEISNIWVNQLETAYEIMIDHVKPIEKPDSCEFHSNLKPYTQCIKCGRQVCSACIEEKNIFGTYFCDCSLCIFKQGIKRMRIIYIISTIFPALILNNYIWSFFYTPPIQFLLMPPIDASPMFAFFIAVSVSPYGFGLFVSNIRRKNILNKLNISHPQWSFGILGFFTIFIAGFYAILFYSINEYLMLGWVIWTIIYILIVHGYDCPRKVVSEEDNVEFRIKTADDKFNKQFLISLAVVFTGLIGFAIFGVIWKFFLAPPEIDEDLLWLIFELLYETEPIS